MSSMPKENSCVEPILENIDADCEPVVSGEFPEQDPLDVRHISSDAWKSICGSEIGTAHVKDASVCQDFSCAQLVELGVNNSALILTCADGAGSARHSHLGARISCIEMQKALRSGLIYLGSVESIEQENVVSWFESLQAHLVALAKRIGANYHDLACTLLVAIVGENCSLFAQVGDGAIIVNSGESKNEDDLDIVFWPDNGDYLNITTFVTSDHLHKSMSVKHINRRIDRVAMITDGLELLALNFRDRTAHAPFFIPMFRQLQESPNPALLVEPLKSFLSSHAINAKTDDDKTLMLAIRSHGDAVDKDGD